MYKKYFKRIFDILISFLGLLFLSICFLVIAIIIKLDSSGSIIFRQKRVGLNGDYFEILKFRTMKSDTPKNMPTHMLDDPDYWLTKSGKWLRKTSLDELPQIINILKGDMSIVGPRPALWNQYDLIQAREFVGANAVRPGLTGLAQISGRDELEIGEKAKIDGEYAQNLNFLLDCKCFFKTISKVFHAEGVVEGGTGSKRRK